VRGGEDARLHALRGEPGHTLLPVYGEMLLQVCRDYPGVPDPRTLTMAEIRFFYSGLRAELKKHTKPSGGPVARRPIARRRK